MRRFTTFLAWFYITLGVINLACALLMMWAAFFPPGGEVKIKGSIAQLQEAGGPCQWKKTVHNNTSWEARVVGSNTC